jgi:hypothetical protein
LPGVVGNIQFKCRANLSSGHLNQEDQMDMMKAGVFQRSKKPPRKGKSAAQSVGFLCSAKK